VSTSQSSSICKFRFKSEQIFSNVEAEIKPIDSMISGGSPVISLIKNLVERAAYL
jgi:hypothetical protein